MSHLQSFVRCANRNIKTRRFRYVGRLLKLWICIFWRYKWHIWRILNAINDHTECYWMWWYILYNQFIMFPGWYISILYAAHAGINVRAKYDRHFHMYVYHTQEYILHDRSSKMAVNQIHIWWIGYHFSNACVTIVTSRNVLCNWFRLRPSVNKVSETRSRCVKIIYFKHFPLRMWYRMIASPQCTSLVSHNEQFCKTCAQVHIFACEMG